MQLRQLQQQPLLLLRGRQLQHQTRRRLRWVRLRGTARIFRVALLGVMGVALLGVTGVALLGVMGVALLGAAPRG